MPLVNAPDQMDVVEDRFPTRAAKALTDVREALDLIAGDHRARGLLTRTDPEPDPEGDLASWLYGAWWCGPDAQHEQPPTAPSAAARGAARLEAARRTAAPTSAGWLVLAAAGDVLVAARATGRLRTVADAVVGSSRPGRPPRPGDLVTLQHGSSSLDPSGAWWWAHADRPEDLADVALDRWYVHVRDLAGASAVVPLLLQVAAEAGCALSLKCPPVAQGYGRRDALVAYLPRQHADRAEAALRRRADQLGALLAPEVPPCTRRLVPGIAQAQDPGHAGISYGQLRCSQVAALAARLEGRPVSDQRSPPPWRSWAWTCTRWRRCSRERLRCRHRRHRVRRRGPPPRRPAAVPGRTGPDGAPVWSGDDVDPVRSTGQRVVLTHGRLDDGLLTGRTGIATALALCARLPGGRPEWSDLGSRALRSAVRSALDAAPAPGGLGWSSGWLGTARAAGLVGHWTGDGALVEAGRSLAGRAVRALADEPGWCPDYPDLLDGWAGHLAAVLAADLDPDTEPTRRAAAMALLERLLPYADDDPTIPDSPVSWPMAGSGPAVVGLAHGGSGITIALAGARASGLVADGSLEALIARSLRWEDGHFRPEAGGWPDLRSADDVPDWPGATARRGSASRPPTAPLPAPRPAPSSPSPGPAG